MAKLLDTPIEERDLQEYVDSRDDFAFELEVFSIAKGLRFQVEHAGTYEDPVTGKPRQFDVRLVCTRDNLRICFAVECKSTKTSYPLLVSCVPRQPTEIFHYLIHGPAPNEYGVPSAHVLRRDSIIYPPKAPVAKSMRQVGRDSNNEISASDTELFDKWMQAVASAHELIGNETNFHRVSRNPVHYSIVIPILVISDDTLWSVQYSQDGKETRPPKKIEEITFFIDRTFQFPDRAEPYTITHLHIFTRTRFGRFLEEVANGQAITRGVFP